MVYQSCKLGNQLLEHPYRIRSISALAIQHKHLLGIKLCYLKVIFERLDGRAG